MTASGRSAGNEDGIRLQSGPGGGRCDLHSPTALPRATGFLWNRRMLLQVNCRGFVTAQHLQPEPARYSHAPNLEARSFMQPEQPYYAYHPGRFFYIKDEDSGECFSVPHEPVRKTPEAFTFSVGVSNIRWRVRAGGVEVEIEVSLPPDEAVELWSLNVRNTGSRPRRLSVYPFFTIGYMSWMNQSAAYRPDLGGVVATSVTPYQKVAELERVLTLKDKTFLLHDTSPIAWETALAAFEGEGGLQHPDGVRQETLGCGDALYEMPAAVLQYRVELEPGGESRFRFLFGPARTDEDIAEMRKRYLSPAGFEQAGEAYRAYLQKGRGCVEVETPDSEFDHFVNHWLARQVYYHGDSNRMTTDPQTRNYLQDAMGMAYIRPDVSRAAFLRALGQQKADGSMPDGVLLHEWAELKYINQVPHSDHCAWLPVCLQAYLDETGDYDVLEELVTGVCDGMAATVYERVTRAMRHLLEARDARGLSLIGQGDWCDPMNMVGHRGKGVSAWLSMATVHALNCWSQICAETGRDELAGEFERHAASMTDAIQSHFWDGDWFARGITDAGTVFGVSSDGEGRIFLNPQSWAMLAGIASAEQRERMIRAVEAQLEGPYGVEMLAPAYTALRDDVGRLTQKFPGSAENGSVYNHAAAFYVAALFGADRPDHAYRLLRRMIPGPDWEDFLQRGQLPVFIPNYYRGARRQLPRTAGRSSQLFNTGTVSWVYRIVIEDLFGLRGCPQGLRIAPRLPSGWRQAVVRRDFRGARFSIRFRREARVGGTVITVDGKALTGDVIGGIEAGAGYEVDVVLGESRA